MTRIRLLLALLMGFWVTGTRAQTDSSWVEDPLAQPIEDLINATETDQQVDYTLISDFLEQLQKRPLDLNTATRSQLLQLPGLNDLLINQLLDHIRRYGPLASLYELQAIDGFRPETVRAIQPFVTIRAQNLKDINPNRKPITGPGLRDIAENLDFELIQRWTFSAEPRRGYSAPDTAFRDRLDTEGNVVGKDTVLSSRYAGSRDRHYTRFRAQYSPYVSVAVTGEKDPGEAFVWDPKRNYYGYDFLSAHVAIQNYGLIQSLVVGDYTVQTGQGLILSRGLGFGKGADVINAVKMPDIGIRPYASVNENTFFRGAATTLAYKQLRLTAFYSRKNVDGTVAATDTLTNELLETSGLQISGLHRTPSELARRRNLEETASGLRATWSTRTLKIGATHFRQSFGAPINRGMNDYNRFDFRGSENHLTGLDFDWAFRNFNWFGEVARSRSGGIGAVTGMMISLHPKVDAAIHLRHFDRDFHSFYAFAFAERPVTLRNETGLYTGFRVYPNYKWTASLFLDQYQFNWNRFGAGFPSRGSEWLAQVDYRPQRGMSMYARLRIDQKEEDASLPDEGPRLEYLVPTRRTQFRVHFQKKINLKMEVRNRIEFSWYEKGDEVRSQGMMFYQDISYRPTYRLKLTGRFAVFDAPAFDSRIYTYESDLLGFFSIPPLSGVGTRAYLMAQIRLWRKIDLWVRYSQTRFYKESGFGSGLEAADGNLDTDWRFQLRWQF
jgi:hypothetical protein